MFHVLTLTYTEPLEVVDATRPAHIAWIQQEIDAGRLLLAGRQESGQGGVLITADIDIAEAETLMVDDPYSQAGLVRYERVGFTPGPRAPGL